MVVPVTNLNFRPARSALTGFQTEEARRRNWPAKFLCGLCFFISTTGLPANYAHLAAQEVTTVAPPSAAADLPDAPGLPPYPDAVPLPPADQGAPIRIESKGPEKITGSLYTLDDDVVITYGDRTLRADHIEYDR